MLKRYKMEALKLLKPVIQEKKETKFFILSYQLELAKMRAKLVDINHCSVLFLSRAAANLWWYYYTISHIII